MTAPQSITSELQKSAPSSIIELYELKLFTSLHGSDATYRFHSGVNAKAVSGDVVWAGNPYSAMPVEIEGFEYSGQGQLPRPKIKVSNQFGFVSALLAELEVLNAGTDLVGAKFTRIRTLARYLDAVNFLGNVNPFGTPDSTAEFPREIYYLDRKVVENRDLVEYEMAAAFDLAGVRAPKRQCISNICQWTYRSAECGYTEALYFDDNDQPIGSSAQDVCGKRLDSCRLRFDKILRTGSVTKSSTTLTLNTTSGVIAGHPIFGFGIQDDTTVVSVTNGTQLVMSKAATVTNPITMTGTVSSAGPTMTVANGANLVPGLTVTGPYIPPGTTVLSVSSNTVTLSNRPYEFSRVGDFFYSFFTLLSSTIRRILIAAGTTDITSGMVVFGSNSINTTVSGKYDSDAAILLASFGLLSSLSSGAESKVTLFFIPASPSSGTYSFSAGNQIIFRTNDGTLPYGSYPGVGTYFT